MVGAVSEICPTCWGRAEGVATSAGGSKRLPMEGDCHAGSGRMGFLQGPSKIEKNTSSIFF